MSLPELVLAKETSLNAALPDIANEQDAHRVLTGKYLFMNSFNGDTSIYVHEHSRGPGEVGYTVFAEAAGYKKAIGVGFCSQTFDWTFQE